MIRGGFFDLHTHGMSRYDTRTANPEDLLKMAGLQGVSGTSAFLPTIYPGPVDEMRRNLETVRQAIEIQRTRGRKSTAPESSDMRSRQEALILGVHLEGPFLNPARCGALDRRSFLKPTLSSLRELLHGYEEIVKIITVAPEVPGCLRVIERCAESGIRVNMGHSDATYGEAEKGRKAGATGITHIFNAMRPFHHREPGLAGLGLLDEDLYVEVIADGVHLHRRTLEMIFSIKRLDRIILVSDSVKSRRKKGLPVYDKRGVLSGSGATIGDAVGVLRGIGIPDAEIEEAAIDNPVRYIQK